MNQEQLDKYLLSGGLFKVNAGVKGMAANLYSD